MNTTKLDLLRVVRTSVLPLSLIFVALLAAGCASAGGQGTSAPAAKTSAPATSSASATKDQNACHVLEPEYVSALAGDKVALRNQTDAGDTWSTCQWENEKGAPLLMLTVYWSGGKQEWETWRGAQSLGNQALKQSEGVSADQVVKQGLVPGLGDGAYFSGLLPSLVLKGDTLFEMNLFFIPHAETKFVGLAQKLLAKVK